MRVKFSHANRKGVIVLALALSRLILISTYLRTVETDTQKEFLKSRRCQQIQGYLFCPPLFPEEFHEKFESLKQGSLR
ncbi:EAL domain-containing protein [Niallia endozanthoxylica]|uniref:EAL domain-containing protein n=1 Tax=Niallia endozanthoxylica TaxID=2036016 RepID=A0A5J5I269_9BACI|nr:EAL domain-containing protein [Niallia endozanthoxylica]